MAIKSRSNGSRPAQPKADRDPPGKRVLLGMLSGEAIRAAMENGTLDDLCEGFAAQVNARRDAIQRAENERLNHGGDGY